MANQTVTRSAETELEPERVYRVLADASQLPKWAPLFADRVEPRGGSRYEVTKSGETFELLVELQPEARTVDYLRSMADNRRGGAYVRVTGRPLGGSTVVMTVPVGPKTTEEEVGREVERELGELVRLAT